MVSRIKTLSECLSTFVAVIVQFLLLSVFLSMCSNRKKQSKGAAAAAGAPLPNPAMKQRNGAASQPTTPKESLPPLVTIPPLPEKQTEPEIKLVEKKSSDLVASPFKKSAKSEGVKKIEKATEPEKRPVEEKETAAKKCNKDKDSKLEKMQKSKEGGRGGELIEMTATAKEDNEEGEEGWPALKEKDEPEPKTDLDSHHEEEDEKGKGAVSNRGKKKRTKKAKAGSVQGSTEKAETSGYAY